MSIRATILGCGSSAGVPRPALGWGACDPNEPRNRRLRCSLLVERSGADGATRILIDTSPDLRMQLLAANVDRLDAVFLTHEHADQTHGMDDLRSLYLKSRRPIPAYLNEATARDVTLRFAYCFRAPADSEYPPILDERRIEAGEAAVIDGPGGEISVRPFTVEHGSITALGYRIGGLAYTPDVSGIPPESFDALTGLDVWIIDGLRHVPHPSHFSIAQAVDWIERMRPARAIITNMNSDVDYRQISGILPDHVVAAYDGMVVETAG